MRTLLLIRNPFRCEVKDVQLDMQEEFIELTNSSSDKDIYETQDLVTFWLAMRNNYPQSKYCCHSPQRIYVNQPSLHLSSSDRNKLPNVEADLRCALTNTIKPRIKQLVAPKQKQKSH